VILKRLDEKYIEFGFLDDVINENTYEADLNEIVDEVKINLKQFVTGDKRLKFKTKMPSFYSESQQVEIKIDYFLFS
jgi:hypothetical protein